MSDLIERLRNTCEQSCFDGHNSSCSMLPSKLQLEAADALEFQQKRIEELRTCLNEFDALIAESRGVDGWHLNGDVATWEELNLTPSPPQENRDE